MYSSLQARRRFVSVFTEIMLATTEHATEAGYPSLACNVLVNEQGTPVGGYYGSLDINGHFHGTIVTIS
jgi:hypothetical protein